MHAISATKARADLYNLIDHVKHEAAPVAITNKGEVDAYLVGADEYRSIMETLHLFRNPANAAHIEASLAAFDAGDFDTIEV